MIPTGRLVAVMIAPTFLGLAAAVVPGLVVPMLAVDALVLGIALIDLALAWGHPEVERELPGVQSVGSDFEVGLVVRNRGGRRLTARVTDEPPGSAIGLPATAVVEAGQEVRLAYELTMDRRGEHAFGDIAVRWLSPLGLWERQRRLPCAGSVKIYPRFRQLRSWGLVARQDEHRLPVRVRRRSGGENEFERLRPYVAGDPFRSVDWRATARRRELITREYGQESNQNVIFLLDAGRMMSARTGELTVFDHALNAALMMGQVALRHGDRVGLLAFDHRVRTWIPPKGGARHGSRLIRGTYDVFPSHLEPDYVAALTFLAQRVRRRSLVVLLTAVFDEVNAELSSALVAGLGSRHLPLCVWVRDQEIEDLLVAPMASASDRYVACAAAELSEWRERSLAALRGRGALVVDAAPDQLTPALLSRYLEIKARRLL